MHLARKAFVLNQLLVADDNQAGIGDASPLGDHLRGNALAKRAQVSPHDWFVDWVQWALTKTTMSGPDDIQCSYYPETSDYSHLYNLAN